MLEYSHVELRDKDLSNQDLRGFSFDGSTLSNVNLTQADLRGASFVGASIKDLHISLACKTFDGTIVDAKLLKLFIFLLSKMQVVNSTLPIEVRIQMVEALMDPALDYQQLLRTMIPTKEYFKMEEFTLDVD